MNGDIASSLHKKGSLVEGWNNTLFMTQVTWAQNTFKNSVIEIEIKYELRKAFHVWHQLDGDIWAVFRFV